MADDEIASGLEARQQPCNDLALGFLIEIDHHIAQEDDVEFAKVGKGFVEVDLHKADPVTQ